MSYAAIHPDWEKPRSNMADGYSLEMTAKELDGLREAAALIRPGRADRHILIGNATRAQVAGMLRRFWPRWTPADVNTLAAGVPDGLLSMARVQEYLLERRNDAEAVRRDWLQLTGQLAEGQGCPTRLSLLAG